MCLVGGWKLNEDELKMWTMRYARMSYMCWCLSMQSGRAAPHFSYHFYYMERNVIGKIKRIEIQLKLFYNTFKIGWRAPSITGITRCHVALWTIGSTGSFLAFDPLLQLSHEYQIFRLQRAYFSNSRRICVFLYIILAFAYMIFGFFVLIPLWLQIFLS